MTLQQVLRILRARWLLMLITLAAVVGATVAASLILPSRYTATASIVVESKGTDLVSGGFVPLIPMPNYVATQIDIIQSHGVARSAVDLMKLAESPSAKELHQRETGGRGNVRDFLAEILLKGLRVEPSRDSSVVNVAYTGNDPRFAAVVANAFVQAYINANLQFRVQPARQTSAFFTEQVKTLKDNLEKAQTDLSNYQREKGIIATDERLDVENNRLNELSSQLVAAQAQTYDAVGRQRQVQEFLAKGQVPDTLPDVLSNPVIQSLKSNLTALEAKLNDISGKLGKNHPSYQSAVAELEGVRRKLLDEMKTISTALGSSGALAQKREDQIKAALAGQRAKVLQMKQVRDDQSLLVREMENAQRAFDAVMGRMTQTKMESQTSQTNVTVISEAIEPIEPSSPRIFLNTIISIVLGLLIAVALALVREMFDRIVRSEEDVALAVDAPMIGSLSRGRRWRLGRMSRKARAGAGARMPA
jgi:succinoglycan biosynthesis transport protein ExoP